MAANSRIQIVGIGDDGPDGLSSYARQLIQQTPVLLGSASILKRIGDDSKEQIVIGSDLESLRAAVERVGDREAVLLASGDPLFYGIAQYLTDVIGKDRFEVVPHVSSMQLAFARVKESWDEAYLANLASQSLDRVMDAVRTADRVGLFTTEQLTPSVVATALLDRRVNYFTVYVCENLGSPRETVTQGELEDIVDSEFSPLNVMVLVRKKHAADRPNESGSKRLFGNPDDSFLQSRPKRGLLTPAEVRCVALAEMDLMPESTVWDVGAGSGALAIEAAAIANRGRVFAIEMDAEDYGLMTENAARFDCKTLIPVHGQAPEAWQDLPDPDAIFVGGSGRVVPGLVSAATDRLVAGGRIVVNVSSPDNLVAVQKVLAATEILPEVRMISVSRGHFQMERTRFEALNPTFLISGRRGTGRR